MRKIFIKIVKAVCILHVGIIPLSAFAHQIIDEKPKASFLDPATVSPYKQGHADLWNWQFQKAGKIVDKALSEASSNVEAAYFLSHYYFIAGDYEKARRFLDMAGRAPYEAHFEKYLSAALQYSLSYERRPKGHFEYRFAKGIDEILVEFASETLEAARENIGKDLGLLPPETIIVEFVDSPEALAALVGLDVKAVNTTSTIAIAKFNRLLVTTPRVTTMGYRWRDTLAHEYAHLIIAQKSNNTVPIWLHEGIAKFEEERWYKAPGGFLDAYAETMLAKAYYSNKMITLDQMHPSMALLPSREAGATAFAEVLTIIQFLHSQHGGYENIRKLLESLANDDEMDEALKKVYGMTLKTLETRWRQYLSTRGLREKIGTAGLDISFKKNSKAAPKSEENSSSEEEELFLGKGKGAKFFKLGKLLKDRGRNKAALIEIEKAQAAVGKANPMVQNIVADLNIKMSRFADAKAALLPLLELYDGPAMTYYNLGKACMGLGEKAEAIKYFLQTVSINPFDPRSHANLAALYSDMGESEAAEKSAAIYQKLQSYLGKD